MTIKTIEKSIKLLKPNEQIRIVENILAGLHGASLDVERVWGHESDRRLANYKKKKVNGIPFEAVIKRIAS